MVWGRDKRLDLVLREREFTVSVEIVPPRNNEATLEEIVKVAKRLADAGVDFVSVTKGAGGSLRGGSLPLSFFIKNELKIPVISHLTCWDSSPQEIENTLLDHHYLGLVNILALRGDSPEDIRWERDPRAYDYAYQMIQQAKGMANGEFLQRSDVVRKEKVETKVSFCIGCAVYPEPKDSLTMETLRVSKKVEEGATFGITQLCYNPSSYGDLMKRLETVNRKIPVIPGIKVVDTKKKADFLRTKFGCIIPDGLYGDGFMKNHVELVREFKKNGAPGVHIFVFADSERVAELVGILKREV